MAATGATPISLYYSSTASNTPTAGNLVAGELAINTADGKLFYKDSSGVVQVIGTKGGVGSSTTTQVLYNSSGLVVGSANLTFDGTTFTATGFSVNNGGIVLSGNTYGSASTSYLSSNNGAGLLYNVPSSKIHSWLVANVEFMRLDASGNVGIGVTPSAWLSSYKALQIGGVGRSLAQTGAGSGDWTMAFNAIYSAANSRWDYAYTGDAAVRYSQTGAGIHAWFNAPSGTAGNAITFTQAMTLDSSGQLLINATSSYVSKGFLQVAYTSANSNAMVFRNLDTNYGSYTVSFQNSSGGVAGYIQMTSATTTVFGVTSDKRLKTDKGVCTDTSVIDNTIIHDFVWSENEISDKGVFAQEAYDVKPSAIHKGSDEINENGQFTNPWGVDYSKYVPDLIVYCQQLKKSLEELNAKVDAQAAEIQALKGVA